MIRPGFWKFLAAIALGVYLALWLCGGDREADAEEARVFHPVKLADVARTKWTHVSTCGLVTLVKGEADGDIHVRLSEGAVFVVAEIVPYHPLTRPRLGQHICVAGISRIDRTHGSYGEVHPVEHWQVQR